MKKKKEVREAETLELSVYFPTYSDKVNHTWTQTRNGVCVKWSLKWWFTDTEFGVSPNQLRLESVERLITDTIWVYFEPPYHHRRVVFILNSRCPSLITDQTQILAPLSLST